jgi:hypothetical protein
MNSELGDPGELGDGDLEVPKAHVISEAEVQARINEAKAVAELNILKQAQERERLLIEQIMSTERSKTQMMRDANKEQAKQHTAHMEAADAAAARASQLSHSALQGTLAAQLVARCDDDGSQQKIARLVGGIGTKEIAAPSLAGMSGAASSDGEEEEPPPPPDKRMRLTNGGDEDVAGAQPIALPASAPPAPRFCPQCGAGWTAPTAVFCATCGCKRP